jgi:biopolymer transport protein ExbD
MQFRRVVKPSVGINIAPLVDVVFLLVIFFAVSTTFLETAGLELELPSSTATAKREAESLVVSLTQDGQVALGGESMTVEELGQRLQSELEGNESRKVVLRADRRTPHGDVVRVIDMINDAGATGLQLDARAGGR